MAARKEQLSAAAPEAKAPVGLELSHPRIIVLAGKNSKGEPRLYRYETRRIRLEDWDRYFRAVVNQTRNVDGEREQIFENDTARLDLVERVVTAVDGYGDFGAAQITNWRAALPLNHRLGVGGALCSVGAQEQDEDAPLSEFTEIKIDALWSANAEGKMQLIRGLVHRFKQPSIEQLKRWNYESARVRVRGTAKDGVTIYPSRPAFAMVMYDELITGVDGYTVNGTPLTGVDAINGEMDGCHKAESVMALFGGTDVVTIR
jgi:hypothetical protein